MVEMNGEGFELYVKIGDKVKAGDNLIKFDRDLIVQKGYQNTCIVVLTSKGILNGVFLHSSHIQRKTKADRGAPPPERQNASKQEG